MHPKRCYFHRKISLVRLLPGVAYIWLVSNRRRLNNDSAGSHIKEEGKFNMYTTLVWLLN